jgi:hypothetical protein
MLMKNSIKHIKKSLRKEIKDKLKMILMDPLILINIKIVLKIRGWGLKEFQNFLMIVIKVLILIN